MSISVIIPVHNSEKYLKECVESVLQGMKEGDEVILVENGSSDSSWEICCSYSDAYPSVCAVQLETAGVSRARNRGISAAKGDWVVFLDSDDIMDPGFLAAAHGLDIEADIILFDYRFLDEEPAAV
ncbi:MAG: glycosyltransferase, partial [Solobacterium sp.]|nr:glycosyltransferase [Solobacterium sp.]